MQTVLDPPRTKVNFDLPFRLNPEEAHVVSAGSCFAAGMAELLAAAGVDCEQNPNGILYNPVSLCESFRRIAENCAYRAEDFVEADGFWHGWHHHGSFSRPSLEEALSTAEAERCRFADLLRKADLVILTPASASVFERVENGQIVANCHKLPGTLFRRRLLSYGECVEALEGTVAAVRRLNSLCRIVFTLSPVRHNPGDLVTNARSKALLLAAIHECVDRLPETFYFPAYEIVMDELRDYRFFKEDMCHPNETAVNIVTRTFAAACFGERVLRMLDDAERKLRGSRHVELRKR